MTLAVVGTEAWDNAAGSYTRGLTIPEGTKAVVLLAAGGINDVVITLGGLSFTLKYTIDDELIGYCEDVTGRASDTLSVTDTNGGADKWRAVYVSGNEPTFLDFQTAVDFVAANSPVLKTHVAPGNGGNLIGFVNAHKHTVFSGNVDVYTGHTSLYDGTGPVGSWATCMGYLVGADDADLALGVIVGGTNSYQTGLITVSLYEAQPIVTFTPAAFGTEAGLQAGLAFSLAEDVTVYPTRHGAEAGIRAGLSLRTAGARQVMLTGAGIETPEMTEGGTEGQVLTYHEDTKPTWEDGGGPGATALDDLTDVNVPAPGDGQLLAYDDYSGEWVATDPPAGVTHHGDLTGLDEDDHPQYMTAAEVIALLTPEWYVCDSMTVTVGTLDTGAHTDLHAIGGTTVGISEAAATPAINVELAFSGVDAITGWEVQGYYDGSSTHHVHIQLYNYDTAAWVTVGTMLTDTGMRLYSGTLTDGTPYFDGSGNAKMRFYHDDPGNITHDLYLDYAVIGHTEGGGVPSLALDDLTDVTAPSPADGEVLTWDDYLGAWVPGDGVSPALPVDIQVFDDPAAISPSWDKPAGDYVRAVIICIGGGGGGGSGRKGANGSVRYGGGGGGGGGMTVVEYDVDALPASLDITVGGGGDGGAGVASGSSDTDGNAGSDGGVSQVYDILSGEVLAYASGGFGGHGGSNDEVRNIGRGGSGTSPGGNGGAGNDFNGYPAGSMAIDSNFSIDFPLAGGAGGGGGGGGKPATDVNYNGGDGGDSGARGGNGTGAVAATSAATAGVSNDTSGRQGPGAGGGGGAASTGAATTYTAGAAGGLYGGGGGGGGAQNNSGVGGDGGDGADGIVIIMCFGGTADNDGRTVATDAIWDAAGDLVVGSGANTAARLAKGTNGDVLTMVAGAVAWQAPAPSGDASPALKVYLYQSFR